MSVPPALTRLVERVEDLARGRTDLRGGPVRVGAPPSLLGAAHEVPSSLAQALRDADFLAPAFDGPPDEGALRRVAAAAVDFDLFLDLRLAAPDDLALLPETAARRTARLVFDVAVLERPGIEDDVATIARAAARIAGRTLLVTPVRAATLEHVVDLMRAAAASAAPIALELRPFREEDRLELLGSFDALSDDARALRLDLKVPGVGAVAAGPPLDPLAAWNVLNEGYRAAFAGRASLCPLPFLALHFDAEGRVRPCPVEGGPVIGAIGDPDPWGGAGATGLRGAFLEGTPPAPCIGCTLRPRLLRAVHAPPRA